LRCRQTPRRILELGAGDGTLLLRLARSFAPAWPEVELTLLDQHDLVSPDTRAAFAARAGG
jgi:SAM-dependent MidA family methyltransferase